MQTVQLCRPSSYIAITPWESANDVVGEAKKREGLSRSALGQKRTFKPKNAL